MSRLYALILAVVGGLFVYLAFTANGMPSFTQLDWPTYYLTVAFIALVNAVLFAAADFVEE
jgi:hypothetical protein